MTAKLNRNHLEGLDDALDAALQALVVAKYEFEQLGQHDAAEEILELYTRVGILYGARKDQEAISV